MSNNSSGTKRCAFLLSWNGVDPIDKIKRRETHHEARTLSYKWVIVAKHRRSKNIRKACSLRSQDARSLLYRKDSKIRERAEACMKHASEAAEDMLVAQSRESGRHSKSSKTCEAWSKQTNRALTWDKYTWRLIVRPVSSIKTARKSRLLIHVLIENTGIITDRDRSSPKKTTTNI